MILAIAFWNKLGRLIVTPVRAVWKDGGRAAGIPRGGLLRVLVIAGGLGRGLGNGAGGVRGIAIGATPAMIAPVTKLAVGGGSTTGIGSSAGGVPTINGAGVGGGTGFCNRLNNARDRTGGGDGIGVGSGGGGVVVIIWIFPWV